MMSAQASSTSFLTAGSRVVIVVSSGPPPVKPGAYVGTPALIGMPQGRALGALQEAGLSGQVFNDYSDAYKRGVVIGQVPAAGTGVPGGTEAVLLVSSGSAPSPAAEHRLPDVVGLSEAAAVSQLQAAGFSPQIVHRPSESIPPGTVVDQLPSRESLSAPPAARSDWWKWTLAAVLLAAVVLLAALLILQPETVAVPDVSGLTPQQAERVLAADELNLGSVEQTRTDTVAEGLVAAQRPQAGTSVREGTSVNVVVAAAEPLVAVPDVRNQNQADATRALNAAGLSASVTREPSDGVDRGLVIEQAPQAGQRVPEGTAVGIVISEGERTENIAVPQVTGLSRGDAQQILANAGLRVVVVENASTEVASDFVISQTPVGGESVAPGTTVGIAVSIGPPTAGLVAVPNVVGLSLADAQQIISDAGFEGLALVTDESGEPANQIVAQTPAPGEQGRSGSTVVLFYSSGP